jgi:mRNA interferase HigB
LRDFWEVHADSEQQLKSWFQETSNAEWKNPNEVKKEYPSASVLNDNRIVFNIKGNNYRLIVRINYNYQMIYSICDCISYLYFMAAFFLNLTFNALVRREILILLKINPRRFSAHTEMLNKTFNHRANHVV